MTILDEFRRDDARVLDRLVDGELSQAERRALLAALDDEPGGWRRCALAFLEAQSWRWQLGQLAVEPLVSVESQSAHAAGDRPAPRIAAATSRWQSYLVLAASLLVAFGLGTRYPLSAPTTDSPADDVSRPGADLLADGAANDLPMAAASDDGEGMQTLVLTPVESTGDGGAQQAIQLRVNNQAADADWIAQTQSTVGANLWAQMEQEGWQVTRQRRLVPMDLTDGRRLIVPVEEVDLRAPEVTQF
jgi:hypothetical protein